MVVMADGVTPITVATMVAGAIHIMAVTTVGITHGTAAMVMAVTAMAGIWVLAAGDLAMAGAAITEAGVTPITEATMVAGATLTTAITITATTTITAGLLLITRVTEAGLLQQEDIITAGTVTDDIQRVGAVLPTLVAVAQP